MAGGKTSGENKMDGRLEKSIRALTGLALVLIVAGCAAAPPVPEDNFYRLQAIYAGTATSGKLLPGTVEVDRFVADGLTSERPIVYSDSGNPNQVKAYHYHFWIKPPTVMLRDELVSFLRAAQVADRIVTPEMRAQPNCVLTGRIKHLEQVLEEKGSRTLIEVELGLRRPRDGKILYLNSFRAENDAGGCHRWRRCRFPEHGAQHHIFRLPRGVGRYLTS